MPESRSDLGAEGQLLVERDHVRNLQRELAVSEARVEELEAWRDDALEHFRCLLGRSGVDVEESPDPGTWGTGDVFKAAEFVARALLKEGER